MSRELLQQALDALVRETYGESNSTYEVIDAIRAALAQPQAEPAAPAAVERESARTAAAAIAAEHILHEDFGIPQQAQPTPAAPAVQPLTNERINHFWDIHVGMPTAARPLNYNDVRIFARAIEQAHGIAAPGSAHG